MWQNLWVESILSHGTELKSVQLELNDSAQNIFVNICSFIQKDQLCSQNWEN